MYIMQVVGGDSKWHLPNWRWVRFAIRNAKAQGVEVTLAKSKARYRAPRNG